MSRRVWHLPWLSRSFNSQQRSTRPLRLVLALGATYGTFYFLSNHYATERRFQVLRTCIREFTARKLKPKWSSLTELEQTLSEEDVDGYNPRIVEVKDLDSGLRPPAISGGSNVLKSSLSFTALYDAMTDWEWPSTWKSFRNRFNILFLELNRGKGSLWSEIVDGAKDPAIHPEVEWDAEVRLGDDLCFSEKAFLRERRRRMTRAFAKLFDVSESEVDERDLPIVAIAASGGGFRAMCNTAGALRAAENTGILDATAYISAISGSCWTLGTLYSGVTGTYSPKAAATHLRQRVQLPYLDSRIFDMLITKPTNKYLLSGLILKAVAPNGSLSLVDIYGTLISARLFCPSDLSLLDPVHLSLSHFRTPVDDARLPLPIFTAISRQVSQVEKDLETERDIAVDENRTKELGKAVQKAFNQSEWLWYEFSPYEVGCDELGAWIPSWSLGREFHRGKSRQRVPEISFTILAGIYASAFCASLQHYYQEVKPLLSQLPAVVYNWITDIVNEREDSFDVMHPVPLDQARGALLIPNFVRGLQGHLREGSPEGVEEPATIGLMDAGAELNIPYYPLLRRNVDCIIALDASADSQDLWFTKAEAYAIRKGLRQWPKGAKWPKEILTHGHVRASETSIPPTATAKLAEAAETEVAEQAERESDRNEKVLPDVTSVDTGPPPSTYVWIGSSKTDHGTSSTPIDVFDEEALASRDGIGIVYMPILPNDKAVPGIDPYDISTWKFEMSEEESGKLMDLAEYNFISGVPKIKVILKAMWLRKMRARKEAEWRARILRFEHPP